MILDRFEEIRKKTGSWARQVLKNAGYRELPDHSGVQIILCRDYAVDEQALAEEIQQTAAEEFQMKIRVQVRTPQTDTDSKEPWIDMGELRDSIDMDIEIEG